MYMAVRETDILCYFTFLYFLVIPPLAALYMTLNKSLSYTVLYYTTTYWLLNVT